MGYEDIYSAKNASSDRSASGLDHIARIYYGADVYADAKHPERALTLHGRFMRRSMIGEPIPSVPPIRDVQLHAEISGLDNTRSHTPQDVARHVLRQVALGEMDALTMLQESTDPVDMEAVAEIAALPMVFTTA